MSATAQKTWNPADLVWDVEPVLGETGVFFVQSATRAGVKHRVDVLAFGGAGSCTCERFLQFGIETRLRRGEAPSQSTECSHIRRANKYFLWFIKQQVLEARAAHERKVLLENKPAEREALF